VEGSVLVTGVEGMIGYAVALHLREAGVPVVGLDQRVADSADLGVPVLQADLDNTHALYGALVEHRCTAVVHCGAVSGPMLARDDPEFLFRTNVTGTLNVLEAARRLHLRRVVFCSSLMVYGANDGSLLTEDSPLRPSDAYGFSKVAAEAIVEAYAAHHGIDAVSARLAWVYGPRRRTACVIRTLLSDAMAGRPTRISTGAAAMRQYVHVDDIAEALTALLRAERIERRAYNLSGGDYRPFGEIVELISELCPGADAVVEDTPDPEDPHMGPLSIAAIERDLGWTPKLSLADGLRHYRDWLGPAG